VANYTFITYLLYRCQTIKKEVREIMTKTANNRGREAFSGVNPQGFGEGVPTPDPKTKLEEEAKKANTK
jgi:small acid-soluble spore protein L (minor)